MSVIKSRRRRKMALLKFGLVAGILLAVAYIYVGETPLEELGNVLRFVGFNDASEGNLDQESPPPQRQASMNEQLMSMEKPSDKDREEQTPHGIPHKTSQDEKNSDDNSEVPVDNEPPKVLPAKDEPLKSVPVIKTGENSVSGSQKDDTSKKVVEQHVENTKTGSRDNVESKRKADDFVDHKEKLDPKVVDQPPRTESKDASDQMRNPASGAKDAKQAPASSKDEVNEPAVPSQEKSGDPVMNLAVVACGDRLNETLVMFKSALVFARPDTKFHFYIFADDDLQDQFRHELDSWPRVKSGKVDYSIYPITFPRGDAEAWRKLFKPCATQRLFLPEILTDVEELMYVDTDILFLTPMEEVWEHFKKFNSTQLAALAPEHESPNAGWYNRFARHPFYPPLGVNSGVMLLKLPMMREVNWVDHMTQYYEEYRYRITWGDQDLINIFFHYFPERLYVYPCHWNYRPDHCMYMSVCKQAEKEGVRILHGNRGVYHNEKQPAFKAIFQAFYQHKFDDSRQVLVDRISRNMNEEESAKTPCGRIRHNFVKASKNYV